MVAAACTLKTGPRRLPRVARSEPAISPDDVYAAAQRVRSVVHRTPVLESSQLNERAGGRVLLKCENLQRTGSFKFRGASNAVASLTDTERAAGIIAYSSGNHAQAVALAARLHGVDATIVMPLDAPANKLAATRGYGATVITYDRYTESREEIGASIAEREGRSLIKPYDHPPVMAGQGTTALELLEDHDDVDQLVVCLGGGGLLSGCATIAKHLVPGIEVFGVEPEAGDDHRRSRAAGERVTIDVPQTIADGQQTTAPGELTWPITDRLVTDFLAVTDDEIVETMRFLFETVKLVAEPSGATALAAVLHGHVDAGDRVTGVTISGGNVDVDRFADLMGGRRIGVD